MMWTYLLDALLMFWLGGIVITLCAIWTERNSWLETFDRTMLSVMAILIWPLALWMLNDL